MKSTYLDFQTESHILLTKEKKKEHSEFYSLLKKDYINNQSKLKNILNAFNQDVIVEFISFNNISGSRVHKSPDDILKINKPENELKFSLGISNQISLVEYVNSMKNIIKDLNLESKESPYSYLIESRNQFPLFLLRSENNNIYAFYKNDDYKDKFNFVIVNDTEYFTMYNKFNIEKNKITPNVDYQIKNSSLLQLKTSHNSKYITETNKILSDYISTSSNFFNLLMNYKKIFNLFYKPETNFEKTILKDNKKFIETIDLLSLSDDCYFDISTLTPKSKGSSNKNNLS